MVLICGSVGFLIKRNVKVVFGLKRGHIQPIWDYCFKLGIRIIDKNEKTKAVHMAQTYSILKNETAHLSGNCRKKYNLNSSNWRWI